MQPCPSYAGHRFPAEIISHAVWLYFRFPLSLRHVDEILAARGITVSHETVRQWGLKFGQSIANQIRRRLPRAGDTWHLDEVAVKIAGKKHWLWRAVDQDGVVLDILIQSRRDKHAAKHLLRKLLKKQMRSPRVMITDKLRSYGAAKREIMPGVEHRQHKGLNNGSVATFGIGRKASASWDQLPSQAASWNRSAMNAAWALMSLPPMFRTCPFLIIAIAS